MIKVGFGMNSTKVKLKNANILCSKCVLHVLQALTRLEGIQELEVDLARRLIKVVYNDENITKEMISEMVNNAIEIRVPREVSKINEQKDLIN
ncbi:MAG TPA: heavy metal-associated domain-containing protein [Clostridia bacterium]|nr:heavy metal-associated domain-containing protein [Clostridia bacterium]